MIMDDNNNELYDYVLTILKSMQEEENHIEFSLTLPCFCCSESKDFYALKEELENKTDNELIRFFEEKTETCLGHVTSWYPSGNSFHLNFYSDN